MARKRLLRILSNIALVALTAATAALIGFASWKLLLQPTVSEALPPVVTPSASPSQSAAGKPVAVFLGDAYTASAKDDWVGVVAKTMKWKAVNLAAAGTGYAVAPAKCADGPPCQSMRQMLSKVVKLKPAVVIVTGGQADGTRDVSGAVQALLNGLARDAPDAKVYVVSPFTGDSTATLWLDKTSTVVKTVSRNAGATYIDIGQPLLTDPSLVDARNLPTKKGYAAIAQAVLPDLE